MPMVDVFLRGQFVTGFPAFMTNLSFSCELGMKALMIEYDIDGTQVLRLKGHELYKLFRESNYGPQIKEQVVSNCSIFRTIMNDDERDRLYDCELKKASNSYNTWRYFYEEKEKGVKKEYYACPEFLLCFSDAILATLRSVLFK